MILSKKIPFQLTNESSPAAATKMALISTKFDLFFFLKHFLLSLWWSLRFCTRPPLLVANKNVERARPRTQKEYMEQEEEKENQDSGVSVRLLLAPPHEEIPADGGGGVDDATGGSGGGGGTRVRSTQTRVMTHFASGEKSLCVKLRSL